jgi:hypothetical protein
MHQQENAGRRLGDILVEINVLHRNDEERLLRKLPAKGRLGDILENNGLITQDQLAKRALSSA